MTQVHKLYLHRGFKITHMNADCEFEPLHKEMIALDINLNCAPQKEHVPEIERFIRTVKERIIPAHDAMTFKRIFKLMIVHLVASTIFWIDAHPSSAPDTVPPDIKVPGQLLLRTVVKYKKVFRLYPGEYVQVHQEDEPRNMIDINQTVRAIFLGP